VRIKVHRIISFHKTDTEVAHILFIYIISTLFNAFDLAVHKSANRTRME
jgi:hypothetical protein